MVVTNSLYQLGRLAAVRKGEAKSIAALPEYTFFRNRYPLGDAEETALRVPERSDDPPLVRPALADRRLAPDPRRGRDGRAAGVAARRAGARRRPAGPDLHRSAACPAAAS